MPNFTLQDDVFFRAAEKFPTPFHLYDEAGIRSRARELNEHGMVVDFSDIKRRVSDRLDHQVVNDILGCNPTAENMARWCCEQVPNCYRVDVQETQGNVATYELDD